jgi:hypothetical protein
LIVKQSPGATARVTVTRGSQMSEVYSCRMLGKRTGRKPVDRRTQSQGSGYAVLLALLTLLLKTLIQTNQLGSLG